MPVLRAFCWSTAEAAGGHKYPCQKNICSEYFFTLELFYDHFSFCVNLSCWFAPSGSGFFPAAEFWDWTCLDVILTNLLISVYPIKLMVHLTIQPSEITVCKQTFISNEPQEPWDGLSWTTGRDEAVLLLTISRLHPTRFLLWIFTLAFWHI